MDSKERSKIVIEFPTDEDMKREILQRIEVRIPAAFNQALDKMRLLGGVKKSDAVTEALKRFFEDFDQSDIKKLRK